MLCVGNQHQTLCIIQQSVINVMSENFPKNYNFAVDCFTFWLLRRNSSLPIAVIIGDNVARFVSIAWQQQQQQQ
jgi:hypothetical protein